MNLKKYISLILVIIFTHSMLFSTTASTIKKVLASESTPTKIDFNDLNQWYIYDHYDRDTLGNGSNDYRNGFISSYDYTNQSEEKFHPILRPYYSFAEKGYKGGGIKGEDTGIEIDNTFYNNIGNIRDNVFTKTNGYKSSIPIPPALRFTQHMFAEASDVNTKLSFLGYGYGNTSYADFMLNNTKYEGHKSVSFDIDMSKVHTHTFAGTGVIFNAKVTPGRSETPIDSRIDGYIVYLSVDKSDVDGDFAKKGKVHLIKLQNQNLNNLHEHGEGIIANADSYLGDWSLGSDKLIRLKLDITKDSVKIAEQTSNNGIWEKSNIYTKSVEAVGTNFGPITNYTSHSCDGLSYIEMSNLVMGMGHRIEFNMNDSDNGESQAVWNDDNSKKVLDGFKDGETVGSKWPKNPTREGYEFVGWSTNKISDGNDKFDKTTEITESVCLYAQWKVKASKLIFDSNEKSSLIDKDGSKKSIIKEDYEIKNGDIEKFPIVTDVIPEYTFVKKWIDQDNNEYEVDDSGRVIKGGPIKVIEDKTYTFKPVIIKDSNGDGIDDYNQALYSVNFQIDNSSAGNISDKEIIKYWVAGKEGTKKGLELNVLDIDNVRVSADGKAVVTQLTTPELRVNQGYIFQGFWTINGVDRFTKYDIEKLKVKNDITFKPIFEEDSNGDKIPDKEQSLYSIKFRIDSNKGTTTDGVEYWVAGPKGSQNRVLDVTDSNVSVTKKSDGTKVKLESPNVTAINGGDPFLGNWKHASGNFTKERIATLKIGQDMEFEAIFNKDINGDEIPDDEQALYAVDFVVADIQDGSLDVNDIAKYWVAGTKGTKQGQNLSISKATIIEYENPGTKTSFKVPRVVSEDGKSFTDKWTDGVNIYTTAQLLNVNINKDITFTAIFDTDENRDGIPDSEQKIFTLEFEVASEDANKGSIDSTSITKYYVAGSRGSQNKKELDLKDVNNTISPNSYVIPNVNISGDYMFLETWTDGIKTYTKNELLNLKLSKNMKLRAMFDTDKNGDGIPDSQQAFYTVKFENDISEFSFVTGDIEEYWIAGAKGTKQGQILDVRDATVTKVGEKVDPSNKVTFKSPRINVIGTDRKFEDNWISGVINYTTEDLFGLRLNNNMTIKPKVVEKFDVKFNGNGMVYTVVTETDKKISSTEISEAIKMLRKDGYSITGWKIRGGNGKIYTNAQVSEMIVEEGTVFEAQYKKGR